MPTAQRVRRGLFGPIPTVEDYPPQGRALDILNKLGSVFDVPPEPAQIPGKIYVPGTPSPVERVSQVPGQAARGLLSAGKWATTGTPGQYVDIPTPPTTPQAAPPRPPATPPPTAAPASTGLRQPSAPSRLDELQRMLMGGAQETGQEAATRAPTDLEVRDIQDQIARQNAEQSYAEEDRLNAVNANNRRSFGPGGTALQTYTPRSLPYYVPSREELMKQGGTNVARQMLQERQAQLDALQQGLVPELARGEYGVQTARTTGAGLLDVEKERNRGLAERFQPLQQMLSGGALPSGIRSLSIPGVGSISTEASPALQSLLNRLTTARQKYGSSSGIFGASAGAKSELDQAIAAVVSQYPTSTTTKQQVMAIMNTPALADLPLEEIVNAPTTPEEQQEFDDLQELLNLVRGH
jgi:hypothetical protein